MTTIPERLARRYLERKGFQRRFVETAVGPVHVMEGAGTGGGPTMVLLHGFAASGVQMLPLLIRLRAHFSRLLVPDMPAHGFSVRPEGGDTDRDWLRTGLFEALEQIVDEPVVLFGNSMGGFAAIEYARERPERVARLVLCSPGGASMTPDELGHLKDLFDVSSHREAVDFVNRLLGKKSPVRHVMALGVRRRMARPELRSLIDSVDLQDLLTPEDLARLRMPILMVWGKNDGILSATQRDFFRAHLPPHAHVLEPDGLGHSPYLESPGPLTQHIVDFVQAS